MAGSSVIGALRVTLGLDSAEFTRGTKKAAADMTLMQKRFAVISTGIKTAFAGLAIGGGALAIGALVSVTKNALEMGSSLTEAASKVGVTVEALQEMRFAATQNGISIETMDGSLNKMTKTLGELSLGNKTVAGNFEELGLSARDFIGLTPTEAFAKIADALKGIENESVRAALGNKIFGRSYAELKPLVDLGAAGIKAAAAEKRKDGVISAEQAKTLDDLADGWEKLKEKVGVAAAQFIANQVASQNASDALSDLGSNLISLVAAYNSASNAIDGFLRKIDVYDAKASKKIAERLKESALTKYIPGVQAFADREINRQNERIKQATSNGRSVSGRGRDVDPSLKKPRANIDTVGAPTPYVPRASGGGRSTSRPTAGPTGAEKAAEAHAEKMKALVASLLVEETALKNNREQIKSLVEWYNPDAQSMKEHKITAEQLGVALRQLRDNFFGQDGAVAILQDTPLVDDMIAKVIDSMSTDIPKGGLVVKKTFEDMAAKAEIVAGTIGNAMRDMTDSFAGFVNSIKRGDIAGILTGLANTIGSVLSAFGKGGSFSGLFGSSKSGSPATFRGPAYAKGTNFHPGGLAMVGERGRELVNLPRGSQVIPNHKLNGFGASGGVVRVLVQANDYFDARVAGQAGRVVAAAAPPIAQMGSNIAQRQMSKRGSRRLA